MKVFAFTVTDEDVQQGNPNKPFSCALALAINRKAYETMPNLNPHAQVLSGRAYLYLGNQLTEPRCVKLRNTRAMNQFQDDFDQGNIRHLESPITFRPKQEGT